MHTFLSLWDWLVMVFFLALFVGAGIWAGRSREQNIQQYFLGGRRLPWWLAGVSMVATTFAADTPLAVTELVYQYGIAGNWLWWNAVAGGMLTVFFFAAYWHRAGVMTDAELIELRYHGRAARLLRIFRALYMGLFMNVLIIGWVNLAMISLLKVFFGLSDTQAFVWVSIILLLVAIYTVFSGLPGIVTTDALQFVVAMFGCIVLAFILLHSEIIGGMDRLKIHLPEGSLRFFPVWEGVNTAKGVSIGVGSFLAFVAIQWWASWYPGAEPGGGGYIAQRLMSTRSEAEAVKAGLLFQIAHYALRPWPWIVVALCAVVIYPSLSAEEARMGYVYAMRDFLPDGLRGLLFIAFVAAYMSTISTQLNWGASYLVGDLYRRFFYVPGVFQNEQQADRHYVLVSRLFTILLAAISLVITQYMGSISAVWSFVIECGAGLGLVLILRWYWWRINAWSEIAATITPFLVYGLAKFVLVRIDPIWGKPLLEAPHSYLLTVGTTTLVWLSVTLLTRPTPYAQLKVFYTQVRPLGWWAPISGETSLKPLLGLLIAWLLGVVCVYSSLFTIGYAILLEYQPMAWSFVVAMGSGIMLYMAMRQLQHQ